MWLTRPPYVRWAIAAVILCGAVVNELGTRTTTAMPFAAAAIPRGAGLAEADVEWRDLPHGLWDRPAELSGYAARSIAAGEPITVHSITTTRAAPTGWWSAVVELPSAASPGQSIRLVGLEPPFSVEGVVTDVGAASTFGLVEPGLVAVPPDFADRVARAAGSGRLVVLLGDS